MAHLGMGTMFGMTILGDPQTFLHAKKRPFAGSLKDVPKNTFLRLFIEKGRFHNNENAIRRAIMSQIFTDALGRQLNGTEIDLMLRHFHFQPGNITYEEFEKAIDDMKADTFVPPPPILTKTVKSLKAPAREKTLNSEMEEMKRKHRRDVLGPTDVATRPMTTNMEYGWDTMLYPGESAIPIYERRAYFPKGGTDVTKARGIQRKNENFIGERGGYHLRDRSALSRPMNSKQESGLGFMDIHRRPLTSLPTRTRSNSTSQYVDMLQSNYTQKFNRHFAKRSPS